MEKLQSVLCVVKQFVLIGLIVIGSVYLVDGIRNNNATKMLQLQANALGGMVKQLKDIKSEEVDKVLKQFNL